MISVVIPVYNESKNIIKCLEAFKNQTIAQDKFEIIIVDGASTDNTIKLASKYDVKIIQQKTFSIEGARNDGINIAKYDLIATTDADCIVPEDWLENIVCYFQNNKDCVCQFGQLKSLTGKYNILFSITSLITRYNSNLNIFHATCGANTAFRKTAFLLCGGYKTYGVADDLELGLRIKKHGRIQYNPNAFILYSTRRIEKRGLVMFVIDSIYYITNALLFKRTISKYPKNDYGNEK